MLASDLYLLEKGDSFSGEPNERRSQIFREYVGLGTTGRWVSTFDLVLWKPKILVR